MNNTKPIGKWRLRIGFASADLASNLVWQMISLYLLFFYTNVMGLGAAAVATMFLITKIIDGVTDIIVGFLIDKTKTRMGKSRPWILGGAIPFGITLILCFSVPDISESAKLIYSYITYSLLSLAYTIVNIPLGSLLPALTEDPVERTNLVTTRMFFATIGSTIVAAFTLPMVNLFGQGNDAIGFKIVAIIFAVISVILFFFSVANTREISTLTNEGKVSIVKNLAGMMKCKIFWVNNIVAFFMFGGGIIGSASLTYYFLYVVQNPMLASISATLLTVVGLLGNVMPPFLIKYMSKKNGIILGSLVSAIGIFIIFLGGTSVAIQVIGIIIYGIGNGLRSTLIFAISPDAIDYCTRKIGSNVAGAFSAMTGFCVKVAAAIASSLVASLLAIGNYDATLEVQPQSAINMITVAFIFIPILCSIITIVAMMFYNVEEDKMDNFESVLDL